MTSYLLDTNALSEAPKKVPDPIFREWLAAVDETNLFTSCLVLGEIRKGVLLVADDTRQKELNEWLDKLAEGFNDRIIGVDKETSLLWGELVASGTRSGRTPPITDALIAAQCMQHQLVLVTRNVRNFEQFSGLKTLCPWSSQL